MRAQHPIPMACNDAWHVYQTERCAAVCSPPRRMPCPRRGWVYVGVCVGVGVDMGELECVRTRGKWEGGRAG